MVFHISLVRNQKEWTTKIVENLAIVENFWVTKDSTNTTVFLFLQLFSEWLILELRSQSNIDCFILQILACFCSRRSLCGPILPWHVLNYARSKLHFTYSIFSFQSCDNWDKNVATSQWHFERIVSQKEKRIRENWINSRIGRLRRPILVNGHDMGAISKGLVYPEEQESLID